MWLETVEFSSGHTSPMHGTVATQVTNGLWNLQLSSRFPSFFWGILITTNIPEWTEVSDVRKCHFCSSFSGLQQHSHYLYAEQHQNQVDLHRAVTSSSQIAATAAVFYCLFPLLNSTLKITLMMLAQYVSKCIHHPPKKTFLNTNQWTSWLNCF